MNNQFMEEFITLRNETLQNIQLDINSWNKFIIYWSKILDKYSIDNVLNLFGYNSSGRIFMTFDEWNSDDIGRKIKPKSKGIPILKDNSKIYVFDIRQTYGKDYSEWNYNHLVDYSILNYYQYSIKLNNNDSKNINENFYDIFYKISLNQINNNYQNLQMKWSSLLKQ